MAIAFCRQGRYPGAGGGTAAAAFFLPPEWPLNVRVGANSPSLWPTMSSVTNSRMCCLPLWTRNVAPTNSGTIVQSRAQVLIGSRVPTRSTFANSRTSTYGPFFRERLMATQVLYITAGRTAGRAGDGG